MSSFWTRWSGAVRAAVAKLSIEKEFSLLNTGLDMESLSICVRLCEQGINPEALSAVIKELRKASESLKVEEKLPYLITDHNFFSFFRVFFFFF
uniref:Mitotic spindle organizing protein 1 n=1 Tax=Oryzias latipes TaxID=8090 RepID=A0A3P9M2M4_ORYLA